MQVSVFFRRAVRIAVVCFALLAAGVMISLGAALFAVWMYFDGSGELPADCAVVFGAAVFGSAQPGPAVVRRVSTAALYYKEGRINRLILTGGVGEGNLQSEASIMRSEAIRQGVSAGDILVEDRAHSTWENIAYSQNLTSGCSSVVAISDRYHLARIELLSWRQGWGELATIPAMGRPSLASEQRSILREALGILYYGFALEDVWPLSPSGTLRSS